MLQQFPTARRLPNTRPGTKSNAPRLCSPWQGEESDDYRNVIAVLNSGWRVIACKTSIQWILQKRRGSSDRWRSRYFCRSRDGLIQCVREHAGEIDGVALVRLLQSPMWIGGPP